MRGLWATVLLGAALVTATGVVRPQAALALPVDRVLDLTPGELHFERVRFLLAAAVEPADLATAELLASGETLITPLRAGSGLIYFYEEGQLEVIRLRVGPDPFPAPPQLGELRAVKHACHEVETHVAKGETFLHVTIPDQACRVALKAALAAEPLTAEPLTADHLRVVYEVPALQAQLRDMGAKLEAAGLHGLSLAYAGATLTLKGKATPLAHQRALSILWAEAIGRLDFDDQIELPEPLQPRTPQEPRDATH